MDWQRGGRDRATLGRLLKRVRRWRARLYRADGWAAYADLIIPVGRLFVGKEETHGIGRDHARRRHWLARFRWRSIVVSKAERMVDASIARFARFGGNDKIQDLVPMLA
ncbi:MAG TPA: IS1 family transposase [Geminicoccaceae bacterium]|nr:IS1 family transposase [Geminicoccaceae bacterium]